MNNEIVKDGNDFEVKKLTKEKVEQWLGTSNQLSEAIEVIYEILVGEYSAKALRQDIIEYYNGDWEYKEEEK
jgi:hypothetical protein